jgi:hypothetical protein
LSRSRSRNIPAVLPIRRRKNDAPFYDFSLWNSRHLHSATPASSPRLSSQGHDRSCSRLHFLALLIGSSRRTLEVAVSMMRAIVCASLVLTVLVSRPARCEALQLAASGIVPPIVMTASWYGVPFHGRKMADGTIFDMNDSSVVAHKYLDFGTRLLICNGLLCVQSQVRDRGPYIKGRDLDLSRAAARVLGIEKRGVARVRVWLLGK